nr:cation-transporting P-type ATPase [Skermanella pratensis]
MTVDTRPRPAPAPDGTGSSDAPEAWHAVGAPDALRRFGTGEQGLSAEEAAARLARIGPNRLTPPPGEAPWFASWCSSTTC